MVTLRLSLVAVVSIAATYFLMPEPARSTCRVEDGVWSQFPWVGPIRRRVPNGDVA